MQNKKYFRLLEVSIILSCAIAEVTGTTTMYFYCPNISPEKRDLMQTA